MTEFKQIVGRGTRIHEDTRKFYFTLIDFRGATSHFADPDFDGEPVQIYEPGEHDPVTPPDGGSSENLPVPGDDEVIVEQPNITINTDDEKPRKVYVDGVRATNLGRTCGVPRRRKKAHTIYSVPESAAQRIHTRLLNAV